MRGRKPGSPKVQDLAAGTLRVAGGTDVGDPPPPPADPDAPPAWLTSEDARQCWRDVLPDLKLRKQYIRLFERELGRYCAAFGDYVQARRKMDEAGGAVVKSKKKVDMLSQWWVVANRAHETMLKLAADLGLNPVAQLRLAGIQLDLFDKPLPATGTDGGGAPANPFGQFRRS